MAVFIELVTDAFDDVYKQQVNSANPNSLGNTASRAGSSTARRPLRGIEIKEDTYAHLRVVLSDGTVVPLTSAAEGDWYESAETYSNFLLQSVVEQRAEKHQIVETFGDDYIFLFGEAPRFLQCSAILLNTLDFNWEADWWENYDKFLRGSKVAELGGRCYMFYDDIVLEGVVIDATCSKSSGQPYIANLQFKLFVTKYNNVSTTDSNFYPTRPDVQYPTWGDADSDLPNRTIPIRSLVGHNRDEFFKAVDAKFDQRALDKAEVDRTFREAKESVDKLYDEINKALKELGVDEDKPSGMNNLGFGPRFINSPASPVYSSVQGLNNLFQQPSVTFGALSANASGGVSAQLKAGFYADISAKSSVGINVRGNSSLNFKDPLGLVYGEVEVQSAQTSFTSNRGKFIQGAVDSSWGYPSNFGGVGFGQTGFGQQGSAGFGSASGGDPGYQDSAEVSISVQTPDLLNWLIPQEGGTAFTSGYTTGDDNLTGSTSQNVEGDPSLFSINATNNLYPITKTVLDSLGFKTQEETQGNVTRIKVY